MTPLRARARVVTVVLAISATVFGAQTLSTTNTVGDESEALPTATSASSSPPAPSLAAPLMAFAASPRTWANATLLAPTRAVGVHASRCTVHAVANWYKVRCPGLTTAAITEVGLTEGRGTPSDVQFNLDPAADDGMPREGEVVFELADGERRVFSFWTFGDGYDGPLTVIAGVVIQASRIKAATTLLLHDALNQPIRTAQSELRRQRANSETTNPH